MKHSVRHVTDERASLSCFKKVQASVAWVNITAPVIYLEEGGAYREHLAHLAVGVTAEHASLSRLKKVL
jgi:hypothetical protein